MTNKPRSKRHIRVRGIRRSKPDLLKLARALVELARAQAEKDAEIDHKRRSKHG